MRFPEDYIGKVIHGDCLSIMKDMPDGCVDLIFTSPPYNLGTTTGGGFPLGHYAPDAPYSLRGGHGKWPGAAIAGGYGVCGDAMPHDEYVEWQKEALRRCWRVLANDGAIFYNHKQRVLGGEVVTPLHYNPDLPVRQIVIWARSGGINFSSAFYLPTHEWIVVFAKPDWRLKSKGASGVGDLWYVPQEANPLHPAPFPLEIPLKALETTNGRVILDPFCGSGTTLVAAKMLGRHYIGIDIEEKYVKIAEERLRNTTPPLPFVTEKQEQMELERG